MKIDYKHGKVFYNDDDFIKFLRRYDKIICLGDKYKIEKVFRQDVLGIKEFFDSYYGGELDVREIKYLLLDITLITDNYFNIVIKLLKSNDFKKVVFYAGGILGELNLSSRNVKVLKDLCEVYNA